MWRRSYLLLLFVRIYFALSPSYLHPDENFQGPEIIAGELFRYPVHKTWEWTSKHPIRSVFPLWPVYGIPMTLLRWTWSEQGHGPVDPEAIYYTLRLVMFALNFVLEAWAIHELAHSLRHSRQAVILVASSYVTWSYQSHTFSNSIETLLVVWSLVLMERIVRTKGQSSALSCGLLSLLFVFGIFNRITFPAFIVIPAFRMLPYLFNRPVSVFSLFLSAAFFTSVAIMTDTAFYLGLDATASLREFTKALTSVPVITPWHNIRYNTQTSNLALHGLHPHYQHFLFNLPQLLGPALILLFTSLQPFSSRTILAALSNPRFLSAVSGTAILSVFPHQEPRFLLPCLPLLLSCVRLPISSRGKKAFWASWVIFNGLLGLLMGVYHQGGVIPAQLQIPRQISADSLSNQSNHQRNEIRVFWWKTYPPPTYLLGTKAAAFNISTTSLMGLPEQEVVSTLSSVLVPATATATGPESSQQPIVYLVAPRSSIKQHLAGSALSFLPSPSPITATTSANATASSLSTSQELPSLTLTLLWSYAKHINLDDLDFGGEGIRGTLARVVGRRGIAIWRVRVEEPVFV